MSYILDALRRADAERERGEVPGLQSQQQAMLDDDDVAPRAQPLVWAIVALAIALAAALAWNFFGGEPPRAMLPPPPVAAPTSVAAVVPPTAPASAEPVAPIVPVATVASAVVPLAPSPRSTATAGPRPLAPRRVAVPPASVAASATSSRAVADSRVYAFAELPENLRRDMPKLAFGGSSYSGSVTSRMVILNGQVFHEGDTVAPGLKLQQIKPKAAVLSFRDYRFELSY
jgi:general secretion pathway protein B